MITEIAEQRYAAFRHGPFLRYLTARFLATFSAQIVSVAVGWQIYDLTRDPFDLGLVGIIQFLPALLLVLVTGAVADRFGRRLIMALSSFLEALCALAILLLTLRGLERRGPDLCRAGHLRHRARLLRAGLQCAGGQSGAGRRLRQCGRLEFVGLADRGHRRPGRRRPALRPRRGGGIRDRRRDDAGRRAAGAVDPQAGAPPGEREADLEALFAGFRYIWKEKIVLGAISLDLFAVLLSGASALLPVYARDILELGPWGLGLLRAAPGIGAIGVAIWLAGHTIRDHAGVIMLAAVALFGAFTIVFGVSTLAWLSILALAVLGATDMVSVYVRETLIQLWTPDELRGRVNAVNSVFVGASNEARRVQGRHHGGADRHGSGRRLGGVGGIRGGRHLGLALRRTAKGTPSERPELTSGFAVRPAAPSCRPA